MGRSCVKIREGSGFFAAEDYILTCRHIFEDRGKLVLDEKAVPYLFENNEYKAEVEAIDEEHDLVLLHVVTAPEDHSYKVLDRVAKYKTPVIVKGFPEHEEVLQPVPASVGKKNGNGKILLYDANGTTKGYSGGPVCPEIEEDRVVGIFNFFIRKDQFGHRTELAGMIPASVALELWDEFVEEAHYSVAPNENNPFVYNSLKTDFIDPYNNLEKLQSFIKATDRVLWWSIVAEGGSGKSRLAHELAVSLSSEWDCDIFKPDDLKKDVLDERYFSAGRNMLIIADYANTDSGELGGWLNNAYEEDKKYPHAIRVLLLQRHGKDEDGHPSSVIKSLINRNNNLVEHRYADDLVLKKLEKPQLMDIMRSYAARPEKRTVLDEPTCERLYEALAEVDETLTRPLFAMFITDAYLEGDPYNAWRPEEALAHFARRELDYLERSLPKKEDEQMEETAERLWVLATISRGCKFTREHLPDVTLELGSTVSAPDLGRALERAGFAKRVDSSWVMAPMEPDILGEFFVLRYFREHRDVIQGFLDEAYRISPENTTDFLTRMFSDHSTEIDMITACRGQTLSFDYSVSQGLARRGDLKNLETMYEEDEGEWWLINYAAGLVFHLIKREEPEKVEEVLGRLKELYEKNRDDVRLAFLYARGLPYQLINQKNKEKVEEALGQLKELYEEYSDNYMVVYAYAEGLFNHFDNQEDSDKSDEILGQLKELYEKHRDNDKLVEEFARGLAKSLIYRKDLEKAEEALGQLKELYEKHRDNDKLVEEFARGLASLIYRKDLEKAEEALGQLKELYEKHSDNYMVVLSYAKGLVYYLNNHKNSDKSDEILGRVKQLHEKHRDDVSLMRLYARGLNINLLNNKRNRLDNQEVSDKSDEILGQLKELYEKHRDNDKLVEEFAEGLSYQFIIQENKEKVEEALGQLKELFEEYPDNDRVVNAYARGLASRFTIQETKRQMEKTLGKLKKLYEEYPDDDGVVIAYADALANYLTIQENKEKAEEVLGQLEELYEEYPDNDGVVEEFARGLAKRLIYQKDSEEEAELLGRLKELHEKHPDNDRVFTLCGQALQLFNSNDD